MLHNQWIRFFMKRPAAPPAFCPRFLLPEPNKSKHNKDFQEKSDPLVITQNEDENYVQGCTKESFPRCVKLAAKSCVLITYNRQENAILSPDIHTT